MASQTTEADGPDGGVSSKVTEILDVLNYVSLYYENGAAGMPYLEKKNSGPSSQGKKQL